MKDVMSIKEAAGVHEAMSDEWGNENGEDELEHKASTYKNVNSDRGRQEPLDPMGRCMVA